MKYDETVTRLYKSNSQVACRCQVMGSVIEKKQKMFKYSSPAWERESEESSWAEFIVDLKGAAANYVEALRIKSSITLKI